MTDTPLTRICIVAAGIGALGAIFMTQRGGDASAPTIPTTPPPIAVIRPKAPASLNAYQVPVASGGSNRRALPPMYAAAGMNVAVPDGSGHVRYLPGNDPAAIQYVNQQRAAENSLDFDNSPQNAGSNNLPPPNAFSPRMKRVTVKSSGG